MVYASGFAMGVIWFLFALTGIMNVIAKVTPHSVTRGIQVTLGILLAIEAVKMISTWWILGIISIILVIFLRDNRYAPAAIVLMLLGIVILIVKGQITQITPPQFSLPPLTGFHLKEVWQTLLLAGFAQIPLTATNAVIATASLITSYWPDKPVSEKKLSLNMGIMNLITPFVGGMPMCHGAGGLAGQYYFGARTGGTNIIEGAIEISLGLFFATSIATLFGLFPLAIIGAMMFLVGIELTKFAKDVHFNRDLISLLTTVVISLLTNMAYGFVCGCVTYHTVQRFLSKKL
jgi:MFS superfamily sulfate permease-like transporter